MGLALVVQAYWRFGPFQVNSYRIRSRFEDVCIYIQFKSKYFVGYHYHIFKVRLVDVLQMQVT